MLYYWGVTIIVDKIDPTSEDVERVKHTLSITMSYTFLWNVIRQIYFPCLQLIRKTYVLMSREEDPPPVFCSNVEEWFIVTFVVEHCLLDLCVVCS